MYDAFSLFFLPFFMLWRFRWMTVFVLICIFGRAEFRRNTYWFTFLSGCVILRNGSCLDRRWWFGRSISLRMGFFCRRCLRSYFIAEVFNIFLDVGCFLGIFLLFITIFRRRSFGQACAVPLLHFLFIFICLYVHFRWLRWGVTRPFLDIVPYIVPNAVFEVGFGVFCGWGYGQYVLEFVLGACVV